MEWYVYKRTEAIVKRDLIKTKKGLCHKSNIRLTAQPFI
ncbi:hypothetical protein BMWSH_1988 [Priestia megaterium WSH-002]|uniref:Uncharacterized protein n=1 Tax=Priestia megaterium (strain WSH-002) TaxID=1006007 RepID=A0A8D3WXZ8_PRIMW|nr:hypothetical protein BMWSH_1988 [Priestia megaterium WSH-002]